jgi:hypothetical protein
MESLDGFVSDDELAIDPLSQLGWHVKTVSWRDKRVNWNEFEAVIIRTPWDYQRDTQEFLGVLTDIDRSAAKLENSLDTVKWNLNKEYLRDLKRYGVPVVPTIWYETYSKASFATWLERLNTNEIVLKPTVSATAEHTYRLREYVANIADIFATRAFMVQPFLPAIISEGEYSLIYFGGKFSHAILKSPMSGDFRVQEEHGGLITSIVPDQRMFVAGRRAMERLGQVPLYSRVDLVRDGSDNFLVMELELIEPALYFRTDPQSPFRFAEALDRRMDASRRQGKIIGGPMSSLDYL